MQAKNIIPTVPNQARPLADGAKVPLFRRYPVGPPRQNVAFTGRGCVPDYMSEHGMVMMPEASRSSLENEGVYGKEGMMPPAGIMPNAQLGQRTDEGSGGAGSFATVGALRAKG